VNFRKISFYMETLHLPARVLEYGIKVAFHFIVSFFLCCLQISVPTYTNIPINILNYAYLCT